MKTYKQRYQELLKDYEIDKAYKARYYNLFQVYIKLAALLDAMERDDQPHVKILYREYKELYETQYIKT